MVRCLMMPNGRHNLNSTSIVMLRWKVSRDGSNVFSIRVKMKGKVGGHSC